ncbi:MAG TPA: zinc ribbon domain-containing protein [Thermococcaceae archaeon]|nr:zinc ribbon domain-containing protein [Thermococcaceae archaeon]
MIKDSKIRKEYICSKCGYIFESMAKIPRCPVCKSRVVVDVDILNKAMQEIEKQQKEDQKIKLASSYEVISPGGTTVYNGGRPSETGVKLVAGWKDSVETKSQKGESKAKLTSKSGSQGENKGVKGEKVVVFDGDRVRPGEKPLATSESEVVFSGSSRPPQDKSKGKIPRIKKVNGMIIPTFFIKLVVLIGIVAVFHWKRKEIWKVIDFLLERG